MRNSAKHQRQMDWRLFSVTSSSSGKRRGNIFSPTHKPICQRITSGPRNSINAKPTQLNAENRKATQKSCNPFLFWPRFAVFCLLRPFFRVSLTTRRPDKSNDIRWGKLKEMVSKFSLFLRPVFCDARMPRMSCVFVQEDGQWGNYSPPLGSRLRFRKINHRVWLFLFVRVNSVELLRTKIGGDI